MKTSVPTHCHEHVRRASVAGPCVWPRLARGRSGGSGRSGWRTARAPLGATPGRGVLTRASGQALGRAHRAVLQGLGGAAVPSGHTGPDAPRTPAASGRSHRDERLAHSLLPLLGLPLHLLEPVHGLVEVEHCGERTDGGSQPPPLPGMRPAPRRRGPVEIRPPPPTNSRVTVSPQASVSPSAMGTVILTWRPPLPLRPCRRAAVGTPVQEQREGRTLTEVGTVGDDEPPLPVLEAYVTGTGEAARSPSAPLPARCLHGHLRCPASDRSSACGLSPGCRSQTRAPSWPTPPTASWCPRSGAGSHMPFHSCLELEPQSWGSVPSKKPLGVSGLLLCGRSISRLSQTPWLVPRSLPARLLSPRRLQEPHCLP